MLGRKATENKLVAVAAFVYFGADAVSRAAAVALVVETSGGITLVKWAAGMFGAQFVLDIVSCFLPEDGIITLDGDKEGLDGWAELISRSVLSTLSALPLTVAPAARHRLFLISTSFVGAMAGSTGEPSDLAAITCFAALGTKAVTYLAVVGRCAPTGSAILGSGFGVFSLSSAAGAGEGAFSADDWQNKFSVMFAKNPSSMDLSKIKGSKLEGLKLYLASLTTGKSATEVINETHPGNACAKVIAKILETNKSLKKLK